MWVSEPQRGSRVSTEGEGPTGGVRAPARYGGGRVEVSPRRVRGTSLCVLGVGRGGSHKRLVTYKGIDQTGKYVEDKRSSDRHVREGSYRYGRGRMKTTPGGFEVSVYSHGFQRERCRMRAWEQCLPAAMSTFSTQMSAPVTVLCYRDQGSLETGLILGRGRERTR